MLIAQITDLHIGAPGEILFGGYEPAGSVAAVVARLNALDPRPDLVLLTGDVTGNRTAEACAQARDLLAPLELPMAAIPGNHDERRLFRETMLDLGARVGDGEFLQLDFTAGPLRILGLDTVNGVLPPGGSLCDRRLDWIAARLDEDTDRPTLIAMHHPPFATGIGGMDRIGCANGDALAALVRRRSNIRRVVCGHVHRAVTADWAGTTATICPAVAWEIRLDLHEDAPPVLQPQAPGFQLHRVAPDGRLLTHTIFMT